MRWLLYFIVAIGAVTGKRQQQYEQLHETNDSSHKRVLLQNVFALDEDSTLTEEKPLGFGQGSTRQGFKKGMESVSDNVNGMGQGGGMGNTGTGGMGNTGAGGMGNTGTGGMGNMGVGGMQNLGGMATMGNRTMKMMMMVIKTSAPSTQLSSLSPSPSPFPNNNIPSVQIRFDKVFLALEAPDVTVEPTPSQYKALTRSLAEFFEEILKEEILNEFDALLESIVLTNEFNLFEAGIPDDVFNIYMKFDLSATYSDDSTIIPDEEYLFTFIRDFGISADLIMSVIRPVPPFESVVQIFFSSSTLDTPP